MPISISDMLNHPASADVLQDAYSTDYYWYLRSRPFRETFLRRIGIVAGMLGSDSYGHKILDVGCGEGQLADYVDCQFDYHGFDGSTLAIAKAKRKYENGTFCTFEVGMLDNPPYLNLNFTTLVFGGILEVLVKPEYRAEFVDRYCSIYNAKYFIIYDLERLDTTPIERRHSLIGEYHGSIPPMNGLEEVKHHRKIMVFQARP